MDLSWSQEPITGDGRLSWINHVFIDEEPSQDLGLYGTDVICRNLASRSPLPQSPNEQFFF